MRISPRAGLIAGSGMLGLVCGLVFVSNRISESLAQATKTEPPPVKADEGKASPDEAAVHKALEAYVKAFNENDSKKIAATLSPDAEYIDDESNRIAGPEKIGDMFAKFFDANKEAKLQITPDGARTVAPGVVLEDAESVVTSLAKKTESTRRISLVYTKVDGAWKIASIREYPEETEVLTAEERLKDLSWLVGEWVDETADSLVSSKVHLAADKSHLIREFTVKHVGNELLTGMQWIGVDPLTGNIKGWSFDSAGGRSESTWTKNGDEWLLRSNGVTSDGDESGATYILKQVGKDRIEIKVMHKVVGNTVEADSTSTMVRKASASKK